jgi:hypothetical protein
MASPAAAPAPAPAPAPANSSGVPAPGQRPAGPFSPLFTGGGMWSSQGVDRSQQEQYAAAAAAAARQQAGSAPPGSRQSSIMGYQEPHHLERLEELPRSRPATSSTVRTHTSRTPPPPGTAGSQGVGGMTARSNYTTHSVLSAGSYQAAAAAAAAAVVAANARNRGGMSPGRGGTIQEVERTYVAAAANAAANRCVRATVQLRTQTERLSCCCFVSDPPCLLWPATCCFSLLYLSAHRRGCASAVLMGGACLPSPARPSHTP